MSKKELKYPYPPTHFYINNKMIPANKVKRVNGKLIEIKDKKCLK